jgi:diketogulonate reductase-like aldo/keto reductase
VAALEQLVSDGKIRSWGVSNFDAGDLAELRDVAGDGKIACNQVLYHLNESAPSSTRSFHGAKRMGSRLWRIRHLVMTISRSRNLRAASF